MFFEDLFIIYVYALKSFMCTGACRGQERESYPQELELK